MNYTNLLRFLLIGVFLHFSCTDRGSKNKKIYVLIQPYGHISTKSIQLIKSKIEKNYGFEVLVNHKKSMPKQAFVNIKSPRYRADSMILFQKRSKADSIDYVLGVTSSDISTTKKDKYGNILQPESRYKDWGLFGLGYVPGPSCIVSTYRLGKSSAKFPSRLVKISLHELGHNLGLPHCTYSEKCVMRDAAETILTIDEVSELLCDHCKSQL